MGGPVHEQMKEHVLACRERERERPAESRERHRSPARRASPSPQRKGVSLDRK